MIRLASDRVACLFAPALGLALILAGLAPGADAGMLQPHAQTTGPQAGPLRVLTPDPIERYARFEVAFDLTNVTATNPYWPYDTATPPGVPAGTGHQRGCPIVAPRGGRLDAGDDAALLLLSAGAGAEWRRAGRAGPHRSRRMALPIHAGAGRRVADSHSRTGCGRADRGCAYRLHRHAVVPQGLRARQPRRPHPLRLRRRHAVRVAADQRGDARTIQRAGEHAHQPGQARTERRALRTLVPHRRGRQL